MKKGARSHIFLVSLSRFFRLSECPHSSLRALGRISVARQPGFASDIIAKATLRRRGNPRRRRRSVDIVATEDDHILARKWQRAQRDVWVLPPEILAEVCMRGYRAAVGASAGREETREDAAWYDGKGRACGDGGVNDFLGRLIRVHRDDERGALRECDTRVAPRGAK